MSTLYELTTEYQALIDMLSDVELDEEAVKNCLEGVSYELEKKVEGYGMILRTMESDAKRFKEEADFYSRKAETLTNNAKRLKEAVLNSMIATDQNEIKTDRFTFKVVGNGGKQPLTINEDAVPDSYKKVILETDKAKIREELEAGNYLPFAHLEERGKRLTIK